MNSPLKKLLDPSAEGAMGGHRIVSDDAKKVLAAGLVGEWRSLSEGVSHADVEA